MFKKLLKKVRPEQVKPEAKPEQKVIQRVFETEDEMMAFAEAYKDQMKYAVDMVKKNDGKFHFYCIDRKTYTSTDGKEYPDEVWLTEDDRLILIQDLETEHAKNIIRMMLRRERAARHMVESLLKQQQEEMGDFNDEEEKPSTSKPTYH